MDDEIIKKEDIYYQDIIFDAVNSCPLDTDDITIYNKVCELLDVPSLEDLNLCIKLIHLNQEILKSLPMASE